MGPGDMQQPTHPPATAASPVSLCLHALAQGHYTIALPCAHVHNLISLYQRACVHVPCHATAAGTSAPHFPFLYCTVIIVTPFSDMEPTSPAPASTFHLCCHCHCGKLGIQEQRTHTHSEWPLLPVEMCTEGAHSTVPCSVVPLC